MDIVWLSDALNESLEIATKTGHLQTALRRFFVDYVLLEGESAQAQSVHSELEDPDKTALAHNPTLVVRAMEACYSDVHRQAGTCSPLSRLRGINCSPLPT